MILHKYTWRLWMWNSTTTSVSLLLAYCLWLASVTWVRRNFKIQLLLSFFFWQKQNDIHSFKLIEYIRDNNMINIAKNVKGESANKLTTPKLIAYNDKMPTNNMLKSKSTEYSCFQICNVDAQIIDWICDCMRLIFQ